MAIFFAVGLLQYLLLKANVNCKYLNTIPINNSMPSTFVEFHLTKHYNFWSLYTKSTWISLHCTPTSTVSCLKNDGNDSKPTTNMQRLRFSVELAVVKEQTSFSISALYESVGNEQFFNNSRLSAPITVRRQSWGRARRQSVRGGVSRYGGDCARIGYSREKLV